MLRNEIKYSIGLHQSYVYHIIPTSKELLREWTLPSIPDKSVVVRLSGYSKNVLDPNVLLKADPADLVSVFVHNDDHEFFPGAAHRHFTSGLSSEESSRRIHEKMYEVIPFEYYCVALLGSIPEATHLEVQRITTMLGSKMYRVGRSRKNYSLQDWTQ